MSAVIAVVGNPNVGKSALFNHLTGLNQATGNYPGVTVERKRGVLRGGGEITLVDLPGAYSLAPRSLDEQVTADVLFGRQPGESPVSAVLAVLDATNLSRSLYLLSQLLELDLPVAVALNRIDISQRRNWSIDPGALSSMLGAPVYPVCGRDGRGVDDLIEGLRGVIEYASTTEPPAVLAGALAEAVSELSGALAERRAAPVSRAEACRLLVDEPGHSARGVRAVQDPALRSRVESLRRQVSSSDGLAAIEAAARHQWARETARECTVTMGAEDDPWRAWIDAVLTHRVFGLALFGLLMLIVFQAIFAGAEPIMEFIEDGAGALGAAARAVAPGDMAGSLLADGIIGGVGSVIVFLPQILMLTFFVAVLEDSGYMARAAFLMDRLFSWCGLSGKSFLPMLTSFACAIPGIMATRSIENHRDRLATMLVIPLMSCAARLPVYTLLIAAFVPAHAVAGGWLGLRGLVLFGLYLLGVIIALPAAWLIKRWLLPGAPAPFLLELPSYQIPRLRTVALRVYEQAKDFLLTAGTIIFAMAIIVWALAYFPRSADVAAEFEAERETAAAALTGEELEGRFAAIDRRESAAFLRDSYLGRAGHWVEPVFEPLGWDWRISTAVLASFPARELVVAAMGTVFHLGGDGGDEPGLRAALQRAERPGGTPLFTLPVVAGLLVFTALCCQCGSTLAVMRRATGTWRWPLFAFAYMTLLAYAGAWLTRLIASGLGA